MLNQAIIIGYVTRDPELRELDDGRKVAAFGVASHRIYRNEEGQRIDQTEFHECVIWGKGALRAKEILAKGRLTYVYGSLKTDHWEKDGVKHKQTRIVLDQFRVLDKPPGRDDDAMSSAAPVSTEAEVA